MKDDPKKRPLPPLSYEVHGEYGTVVLHELRVEAMGLLEEYQRVSRDSVLTQTQTGQMPCGV